MRTLTVSRAHVAAASRSRYLAALARVAGELRNRDANFWVFANCADPETFLEFAEAKIPVKRTNAAPEVQPLWDELSTIARYDDGMDATWEEIPLTHLSIDAAHDN